MKLRLSILCLSVTLMSFVGVNAFAGSLRVEKSLASRFETGHDDGAHNQGNHSPYMEDNSQENEIDLDLAAELPQEIHMPSATRAVAVSGELLPAPPKAAEKRFLELCSILI